MPELLLFPAPSRAAQPVPGTPFQVLSDAEARSAALDIHGSWIVEAPAGSGKTGLLIQRYLKLLAHAEIHRPGEVLVLTFTRKADGELRSRVLEQLSAALEGLPLAPTAAPFDRQTRELAEAVLTRDRTLNWRLLDTPAQLNIRTIDSFCAELAAAMPLLSGAGRLQPVDDPFPLYSIAAERTIGQLGGPDSNLHHALRTLLLHRDAQVSDCIRLLTDMLAQREQWSELVPLNEPNLTDQFLDTHVRPRLEHTLERIVTGALGQAADALGPDLVSELARFATRLSSEPGYKENPNPLSCCAGLLGTFATNSDHLPHWQAAVSLLLINSGEWRKKTNSNYLKLEIGKSDARYLEQFIDTLRQRERATHPGLSETLAAIRDLPPARYPDEEWRLVKALCRILSRALVELRAVFAQRGQCDFTEIALTARALLRPDPTIIGPLTPDPLTTPAATLTHLLVDEMQDTSAGQYQLLESLTEFWDGASQTLFLVGDPKQSIYAFRQARVERFLRTMDTGRLGDLPLGPLRLTANFRSQSALVDAFNTTFASIFPTLGGTSAGIQSSAQDTAGVPFIAATAVRSVTTHPALHWHALPKAPAPTTAAREPAGITGQLPQEQPRQMRALIEDFLASWPSRPLAPSDGRRPPRVAVLARNRSHLASVIAEFHIDRGNGPLPFRAVDVESLHDRPEVLDLLALTRALLHPADRVAWLAVLRSPACGLSLADLLALTGEGPDASPEATTAHLIDARSQHLSPLGQALLRKTWPVLQTASETLGANPLGTQIERTWRSLGADALLRPDQRTNCYRFLDLLRKLDAGPDPLNLPLLKRHLQRLYAEPTLSDTPVELMTIHKAKGLEWDLVLVPALERGSGRGSQSLLKWLELDNPTSDGDLLLAPIQNKGTEASSLSNWLGAGERRREVAEAQRLLYVACTRAREELHLFATVEPRADGSLCSPQAKASLLNAAWPAARAILQQQIDNSRPPAVVLPFTPHSQPETLALAASAGPETCNPSTPASPQRPELTRVPLNFDPLARFGRPHRPILPYIPAANLRQAVPFTRPEGSFAARAFGNALHRFLELLSMRLAAGHSLPALQAEIVTWRSRLIAVLRSEGLASAVAAGQSERALAALHAALAHPEGAWLLGPHSHARTEANLRGVTSAPGALRADRTFLSGPAPLSGETDTHLWIVDYKTSEPGGRNLASFLNDQKAKYLPQMQAYAEAATSTGASPDRIVLALYFPLLPALISWPANANMTPE